MGGVCAEPKGNSFRDQGHNVACVAGFAGGTALYEN